MFKKKYWKSIELEPPHVMLAAIAGIDLSMCRTPKHMDAAEPAAFLEMLYHRRRGRPVVDSAWPTCLECHHLMLET